MVTLYFHLVYMLIIHALLLLLFQVATPATPLPAAATALVLLPPNVSWGGRSTTTTSTTSSNTGTNSASSTKHGTFPSTIFQSQSPSIRVYQTYPTITAESINWALEHNLDSKHALTHSLFREVASHLRSNTALNGSREACLPFLIQRNTNNYNYNDSGTDDCTSTSSTISSSTSSTISGNTIAGNTSGSNNNHNDDSPIVTFSSEDLKYALASDYLDACTSRTPGGNISGDSGGTSGNGNGVAAADKQQGGGWRMEGLGSSASTTTGTSSSSSSSSNNTHKSVINSNPHSFQSKRLHWDSIRHAQNTIVFNSAGAHMSSQLAPTSLAALHGLNGAATGICLNLYVTKSDLLQSAPPHTDKQDVVVIQTQGRKRWRVYSPPSSDCAIASTRSMKCHDVDPFSRGKGDDELSVGMLRDEGSELLLDVTLLPGDVLFVPARFPHTTDTLDCYGEDYDDDDDKEEKRCTNTSISSGDHNSGDTHEEKRRSSMHLTLGLDTHVWAMNYMSMRSLALRRFGIHDVMIETDYNSINKPHQKQSSGGDIEECAGKVNQLSYDLREGLFSSLDFGTIASTRTCNDEEEMENVMAKNLLEFHDRINSERGVDGNDEKTKHKQINNTHNSLTLDQCLKTVLHFQTIWQKIELTHQSMYISALKEERIRNMEEGGWAMNVGDIMVEKRAERLSIFRVTAFFEELDILREELRVWGDGDLRQDEGNINTNHNIDESSLPYLMDGDQVEANLLDASMLLGGDVKKGPWSSAKVIKVRADGLYDLQLFDGSLKNGIRRVDIKGPHGLGIFI